MLLDIYIYPHPVLTRVADPIEKFDDELATLADNMAETMYEGNGVGLAGPQVGLSRQIFIVDTSVEDEDSSLKVYINPKIIKKDGPVMWNEGCLSLPGLYRDVKSCNHVIIEAQDLKGKVFREEAEGLRAVALLHEFGHLQGSVFIDRLPPVKRHMVRKYWAKHMRRDAEETYADSRLKCVFPGEKEDKQP